MATIDAARDDEIISPSQWEQAERILTQRLIQALEQTRIAQYVRNGHIEIVVADCAFKPSVRFIRDIVPARDSR